MCTADVGSAAHCLIQTESQQQTKFLENRRGRTLCRWTINKLEVNEKQQRFELDVSKNAERFSELLESAISPTEHETERDSGEDRVIEGWEQLVKNSASKVSGTELIICNRAVKCWDEKPKDALRVRREAYAKST